MQRERMQEGADYVPSLREYAARWGVTPERVRPGQKVMHPGPMNRGVEIDPSVADAADALIETQVRAGLVVRMAVLYDLLTHGPVARRVARSSTESRDAPRARTAPRTTSCARRPRARSREGRRRALDVRVDGGVIAEIGADSRRTASGRRGGGLVLAPAFIDPHVHLRTPGREDEETIASGTPPPPPAASAPSWPCRTPSRSSTRPPCSARWSSGREARPRCRSGSWPPSRGRRAASWPRWPSWPTPARSASPTTAGRSAPACCAARCSTALSPGVLSLHCEDRRSRAAARCTRARLGRARARRLSLHRRERHGRPRPGARRHEGVPSTCSTSRRASRWRPSAAPGDGVGATAEVSPHHLVLTDEAVRALDPNVKMNPPLRRPTTARADRGARATARSASPPTTRRTRPGEGGAVRGGAVRRDRASRWRSPRSTPTSSSRACSRSRRS